MPEDCRPPSLTVDGLVVRFGSRVAVSGLSFSVRRGEIFGLLGPNGAGKTSTLSAIEGLLTPDGGRVTIDGVDVREAPLSVRARVGVLLQASSFQPELTIAQIVRLFAGLHGLRLDRGQIRARLREAGLEREAGKPFRKLSGGQQRRLALLVATAHEPPILLLDEPTTGLDPQSRRQLWDRIEARRADGGSVLLTTHSMEEAQAVCDRVAIVDLGALVAAGTPEELVGSHRDDPRVRAVAHGEVTLEDVFIGLTGRMIRD
ncbi:Nod factor export ATP-binding protein I (fragment) [Nostocoides japonicum T1-X7]|uniref:Nod factor export ATP-binding protein I n=1 Tax=Nostocoides japonicum T1-X7 TaxID=1194083 RepID=A0A077LY68_9MICO